VAPQEPPPDAQQLMRNWRDKYPEGAVDYNAANASMRRGRLAAWAKDFQPTNAEDETIKAYFATPQDPMRTPDRIGGVEVPAQVQKLARNAAANASHEAYLTATPGAVDVSASGTEAMARSMYAGRKAAAQALDDVYTAYRAGMPIADIQIAATKKLTGEMHELAEARDDLLKSMAGKSETAAAAPQTLAERILSPGSPIDPDTAVGRALSKSSDVNADISDLAPKVTRYEAAKAQLTESIGPKASPEAQAHAQAFRAAQQHAETAGARGATQTAENIDRVAAGAPADKLPGGKSIFGKLADMGAVHEALSSVGIFKHALHAIPVIGPLLSVVLKAKLLGKLAGKFGGSFAETAEGTIAAKAAETQNRINGALDAMLGGTAKVLSKRAADTAQPAAALAHALFDNGSKKPYSSTPAAGDLGAMYQARMDELSRAMQPGAIEQAIKARITTSDPTIADAIIESQQRITSYLYNAAPKPDSPPLPGTAPRIPSKTEITNWGMAVAAVHDPAAVYERVAAGGTARPEEIDAVQNCFPALHAAAQQKLVKMLTDVKDPPNYARRVAISSLLGLPLDSSMMGEHATFLQSGYHTPAAQPQAPAATSTLSSSVNIGQRTLTGLDR
jgi:hypothetical protein